MAHRIEFRKRSHEVSRLEAFSDVIFGFAMSLLVVSLEAPKSHQQLFEMVHGFVPFAICFFLFIDFWHEHYTFFKRYALEDNITIVLNAILLFVILFYVYPLKFMFTLRGRRQRRACRCPGERPADALCHLWNRVRGGVLEHRSDVHAGVSEARPAPAQRRGGDRHAPEHL
jgi:hypothetical protein